MTMNERVAAAGHRLLVVDNDGLIRLGTVMMLREMGYAPDDAGDAQAAMALATEHAPFDLLITDYAMPGINGVDLARTLTKQYPMLKVLIVTGHERLDEPLDARWAMLQKPCTAGELRDAVAALLCANEPRSGSIASDNRA